MPAINKLTDADCRNTKPGAANRKLFDGGGLFLFISTTGGKTWRLTYRFDGKMKTMSFGAYPLLTLATARQRRDEAKRKLMDGIDPMQEKRDKREAKIEAKRRMTLAQASETFWDGRKDISGDYRNNAKRGIAMHLAAISTMDIGDITREHLIAELNKMDAAGLHVYVRKVRMWVGQVFDWAVEQRLATSNPAQLIDSRKAFGKAMVKNFAALELDDVPDFMRRLAVENPHLLSVIGCKMIAYTWTRTNEIRQMLWSEVNLEKAEWVIPAGKMKRQKDHVVPLPRQAMALLDAMKARGRNSPYVFPGEYRNDRPMSENTVLYLMYRMGYKGDMTGHGWRSVASTWANSQKFDEDAIEIQLSHVPKDKVRSIYNRYRYIDERREMLQAHADWIESLLKPD